KPPLPPANAASEWRLSLLRCNASVASSCVLPVILTAERSLHFQLRQDTAKDLPPHFAELMRTMTPEQKQQGKNVFESFTIFSTILAFTTIWWVISALRFAANRAKHQKP
ncbi:MAG: hypothetical protein ACR2IV_04295, partial [Bryobacteraceae bacterium]